MIAATVAAVPTRGSVVRANAVASFTQLTPPSGDLSAGAGALVLAAWVVLAVGGAVVAIRRRDV
ncbi:hypothetical protein V3N99_11860 [Dermatophilaceae bacterium Soc4.6]